MKKTAIVRIAACFCMTALICAAATAEDEPFASVRPGFLPWSPLDTLPASSLSEGGSMAWRGESPSLAGNRRAAAEWGSALIAAGPSAAEGSSPGDEYRIFALDPSIYGGYTGSDIFGGVYSAVGAAFFEPSVPGPFFAAEAAVEYVRGTGPVVGLGGRAALAGGLAGSVPFPWSVSAKARAGGAAADPLAEILVEAATVPAGLGGIGQFRLAAAAGYSVGSLPDYTASLLLRTSFGLEGREYRGSPGTGHSREGRPGSLMVARQRLGRRRRGSIDPCGPPFRRQGRLIRPSRHRLRRFRKERLEAASAFAQGRGVALGGSRALRFLRNSSPFCPRTPFHVRRRFRGIFHQTLRGNPSSPGGRQRAVRLGEFTR